MTVYDLYLESGPRRRKTMVHVPALLGCVAVGPTTEDALAATPSAIEQYRRFLAAHGERVSIAAPVQTRLAEHITEGEWLGNGSPSVTFAPDLVPVTATELARYVRRFDALNEALAAWADAQPARALDRGAEGRTACAILLHVMAPVGGYLSAALGGATGFSRIAGAAERGALAPGEALREIGALAAARLRETTPEQHAAIVERPRDTRTLRKALRRMLEHHWEHLAELSRHPGGPAL